MKPRQLDLVSAALTETPYCTVEPNGRERYCGTVAKARAVVGETYVIGRQTGVWYWLMSQCKHPDRVEVEQ